jgi:MFS family permease
MWRLGFFFHEMGFGLLSIFLPLYIVQIDKTNGLFYVGVITAIALFVAIPASFLWGYLCDKTRHYKRYILMSFSVSSLMLYLFTLDSAQNVTVLIILYAVMAFFHIAHEPPKNVLIAELYSHEDWERNFAFYEGFTEVGWLIGLLLGFFMSHYILGASNILLVCMGLNAVALVLSAIFVADPSLIFERSLVTMEKTVSFSSQGVFLASKMLDGIAGDERLKKENVLAFCTGLVLFSLATSILFTPLPIFINNIAADLPAGFVFAIFVLNSSGGVVGYFLARSRAKQPSGKASVGRFALSRGLLAFLLLATIQSSSYNVILATVVLVLMGFAFAVFMVRILSFSMELIPAGQIGLVNVLIGVGGASGSFMGPYIAQLPNGFFYVFLVSGAIFVAGYAAFKAFA